MSTTSRHVFAGIVCLLGISNIPANMAFAQMGSPGIARVPKNTPVAVNAGTATLVSHSSADQMLRLAIGLKPPHLEEEEQFLKDLQDRESPQFHHFLSPEQWNARFAPGIQDEQAVADWATSQGLTVTHRYPNRLLVDLEAPVAIVEKAFNVTLNNYRLGPQTFISNDHDPELPASLANIVESVGGLENFHQMRPAIAGRNSVSTTPLYVAGSVVSEANASHGDGNQSKYAALAKSHAQGGLKTQVSHGFYDPSDIWSSYDYDYNALYAQGHCCNPLNYSGHSPKETSIAVVGAGTLNYNDTTAFANTYGLAWNLQTVYIDGSPANDPNATVETAIDIEFALSMSNSFGAWVNTSLIRFYNAANENPSTFSDAFNQVLSENVTRVMSVSYGAAEEYSSFGAPSVANTDHAIFNNLTGQGWTIVVASGDSGATASCVAADVVDYPGSDPDVISAGGTEINADVYGYGSEVAWTGGTTAGSCGQNNGGSTGGCSQYFAAPGYQSSPACGSGSRSVPDISLNAYYGENVYVNGGWAAYGGTSIVAPQLAGFFAQENAYLLYESSIVGASSCYGSGTGACYPVGNANYMIYWEGYNHYAAHNPFYDITSGCNSNDITAAYNLGYYCAGTGYDLVTGWGSANMLQLAWAINNYILGDYGSPTVAFTAPSGGPWYNSDQTLSWTVSDTSGNGHPANGVAGFTSGWDGIPSDPSSEATPGSGNSYYSGPAYRNATYGTLDLASAGQGCHLAYVQAWDNAGQTAGAANSGYLCYDTVAPVTTASLSGYKSGSNYITDVQVSLSATDYTSGVKATYYSINGGSYVAYSGPFTINGSGTWTVYYYSVDYATNSEATKSVTFTIAFPDGATAALVYVPITPCRLVDTRTGTGAFAGPELAAGNTRSFALHSSTTCAIPAAAIAYALNVTVVPNATLSYLTIWPSGQAQPAVSTLNSDGRIKANAAIVPAGNSNGSVSVYVTDATQFILDIDGYFVPKGGPSGLAFYALPPCRVFDTRGATGSLGGPSLAAGSVRSFPVQSSSCGIPASAQAYSLNFTALPKTTLSYLTVWQTGTIQPNASTLNAGTGTPTANAAIIPAGTSGAISAYVSNATDLIGDINGYFAPSTGSGGLSLYTLPPCRAVDTRSGSGTFSGTRAENIQSSSCSVPADAQAYVLNATVVPPAAMPYVTLWPDPAVQPTASTLNAYDGAITSNMAIVPVTNGKIDAYANASTQLILDISSYFAP